jgi:hypothetical protein
MKVYKLYLDTFKYSYKGYWSSLEIAAKELPKCKKFLYAVQWLHKPSYEVVKDLEFSPNWDINKNIQVQVYLNSLDGYKLHVFIPGWTRDVYKLAKLAEVKEPGKIYSSEKIERHHIQTEVKDLKFTIEVNEIELDMVHDDY